MQIGNVKMKEEPIPIEFFIAARPTIDSLLGSGELPENDEQLYWRHVESILNDVWAGNVKSSLRNDYTSFNTDDADYHSRNYWIMLNVIYNCYNIKYTNNTFKLDTSYNFKNDATKSDRYILPLIYELLSLQPDSEKYSDELSIIEHDDMFYHYFNNELALFEDFVDTEGGKAYLQPHAINFKNFLPTYKDLSNIEIYCGNDNPHLSWAKLTNDFSKDRICMILDIISDENNRKRILEIIERDLYERIEERKALDINVWQLEIQQYRLKHVYREYAFDSQDHDCNWSGPELIEDESGETIISRTAFGINNKELNPYEINWCEVTLLDEGYTQKFLELIDEDLLGDVADAIDDYEESYDSSNCLSHFYRPFGSNSTFYSYDYFKTDDCISASEIVNRIIKKRTKILNYLKKINRVEEYNALVKKEKEEKRGNNTNADAIETFKDLIQLDKDKKDKLLQILHKRITSDTRPSVIGKTLRYCKERKWFFKTPSKEQFEKEFPVGKNWNSISTYFAERHKGCTNGINIEL